MNRSLVLLVCLSWGFGSAGSTAQDSSGPSPEGELLTVAESSNYEATATYDEVMEFCQQLAKDAERVELTDFGESFEGRKLPLLIVADPMVRTPDELAASGKLPVFVMANIHAGEVCGKEATLMLARDLAADADDDLLDQVTLLIAPIYNADGNERFSVDNRPGQVGPSRGMGQRANLQGLDLNRDHIKLESPEARSLARLISTWNPAVLVDTHTTNGSFHRYALTYDGPRHPATPGEITPYVRDRFLPEVGRRMLDRSGYASFFYGNFDDAHQQWQTYPDLPRYSTHYFGLRGCIGILSEAYAYASYRDRVLATKQFVESTCRVAAREAESIRKLLEGARGVPDRVAMTSRAEPLDRPFEIPGYVEDTDDNGRKIATSEERIYGGVRYLGRSVPTASVAPPHAYVVPANFEQVIETLRRHGVDVERVEEGCEAEAERYVIEKIVRADREFQGHQNQQLEVRPTTATVRLNKGDALIKVDQPLASLIVYLLEPHSQDGLASWNFFDEQLEEGAPFPVVRLRHPLVDLPEPSE